MPNPRTPIVLHLLPAELKEVERAAKLTGLPLNQWLKQAVLQVARETKGRGYSPHQLTRIHRAAQERGHVWMIEELEVRGLPRFWAKAWLEEQLASGETYSSIAARYGYNYRTIAGHAQKHHGMEQKKLRPNEHVLRIAVWPATLKELAKQMFQGDRAGAAKWASEAVADGRLIRVKRGIYDLPAEDKVEPARKFETSAGSCS